MKNPATLNSYLLKSFFGGRALWWNVLGIGSLLMMCAYAGLVIFAYYDINGCDPIKAKVEHF
jgi:hypothetical protein